MKYSYNWLKWYIPDAPEADKLADIITYHLFEVEGFEQKPDGDNILDIKILPNRAHDLLSHQGLAREVASLLDIGFTDPTPKYKVPPLRQGSAGQALQIKIETPMCRRYMGRIVRNVKVGPSPEWVVKHLESIGQRSINNVVDAANLVMFDCGQPIHCFDLDKMEGGIIIRDAREGEEMTTLDNKEVKLKAGDMVIADREHVFALAGIKGGKMAEVDENTKNIIIEVANFHPAGVRKTARRAGIFTDAVKRYENDLSPELCDFAMKEISGLFVEYGATDFEDVVDVYPEKPETRTLNFSLERISSILGEKISAKDVKGILERYSMDYEEKGGEFMITVPPMRLDLEIEEDMAEEIGRILGYDRLKPAIPKINFKPKANETFSKIQQARSKLLEEGYSEVMTYAFADKGEVEVLESASDKKFLRSNLKDGLMEGLKLNTLNVPLLGNQETKIFEIGTVFKKSGEEIHVAYGDKKGIKEVRLEEFAPENHSLKEHGYFSAEKFLVFAPSRSQVSLKEDSLSQKFAMWSLFPFIARDVAVWMAKGENPDDLKKLLTENATELSVREPEMFDSFTKDGKTSYAFRLVFQSYDRTLTDTEVNEIIEKIKEKIEENGWQVR